MKNIEIKINRNTSYVELPDSVLGISGENLQGKIIIKFEGDFVDGVAWMEFKMPDNTTGYLEMTKVGETYELPIKSSLLTQNGIINMNLRITEGTDANEIPVFKSKVFYLKVLESINSTATIPEEYPTWIDIANAKIMEIDEVIGQVDNIDITATKEGTITTVTVTNKNGEQESFDVLDGEDYVLTEEDKEEIVDTVKPMVETNIQPILENIENVATQAENIAKGKSSSVVKDTWAEMEEWLKDIANKGTHNVGDNLYIKAKYTDETMTERQPDYWIAEVLETPNDKGYYYNISELESDKPDLTEYAKKEQFVTLTQEEYDTLEEKSATTYYFIPEEE